VKFGLGRQNTYRRCCTVVLELLILPLLILIEGREILKCSIEDKR
jgi:hypothetical protein